MTLLEWLAFGAVAVPAFIIFHAYMRLLLWRRGYPISPWFVTRGDIRRLKAEEAAHEAWRQEEIKRWRDVVLRNR